MDPIQTKLCIQPLISYPPDEFEFWRNLSRFKRVMAVCYVQIWQFGLVKHSWAFTMDPIHTKLGIQPLIGYLPDKFEIRQGSAELWPFVMSKYGNLVSLTL